MRRVRGSTVILGALLAMAAAELIARGAIRSLTDSQDFALPFLSARAWSAGKNPYDRARLIEMWPAAAPNLSAPPEHEFPLVYPPSALPLIALVGWMPWAYARVTILAVHLLAIGLAAFALARLAGIAIRSRPGAALAAVVLAFAPLHTGLSKANLSVLAGALCIVSLRAATSGRDIVAGVVLAIALSLKPTLGVAGFVFFVVVGQPRVWATALVGVATMVLLAALGSGVSGWTASWTSWLSSVAGSAAAGHINDSSPTNPSHYQMINLQVPLSVLISSAALTTAAALAIVAAGGWWLARTWRMPTASVASAPAPQLQTLPAFATVAALSLLVLTHRTYDAVILLPAAAWGIAALHGRDRRLAVAVLACCAVFLLPGAATFVSLANAGYFRAWKPTWIWNVLVLPHQTFAICLLVGLLTAAIRHAKIAPLNGPAA